MENKKTTELLELIEKVEATEPYDSEKMEELKEELLSREPFYSWFNPEHDESLPAILELIRELQKEVKELKRHKHDERTGDVMIRI